MTADELERVALAVLDGLQSVAGRLRVTESFALTRAQHTQMESVRIELSVLIDKLRPRTTLSDCRQCKGRGYVGGEDNPSSCPNFHTGTKPGAEGV